MLPKGTGWTNAQIMLCYVHDLNCSPPQSYQLLLRSAQLLSPWRPNQHHVSDPDCHFGWGLTA